MPRAATCWREMPVCVMTCATVAACEDHISRGSCSTHPGCGKYWRNSICAVPHTSPSLSKTMVRELVVPWSRARMYCFINSNSKFLNSNSKLLNSKFKIIEFKVQGSKFNMKVERFLNFEFINFEFLFGLSPKDAGRLLPRGCYVRHIPCAGRARRGRGLRLRSHSRHLPFRPDRSRYSP